MDLKTVEALKNALQENKQKDAEQIFHSFLSGRLSTSIHKNVESKFLTRHQLETYACKLSQRGDSLPSSPREQQQSVTQMDHFYEEKYQSLSAEDKARFHNDCAAAEKYVFECYENRQPKELGTCEIL